MVNSATLLEVLLTKKLTLAKSMLPQKTKPKPKDEDEEDDSFWVYSEKEKNILFKLDKHMNIIDKLQINICKIQNDFIKSLEYNNSNDSILLNFNLKQ